MVQFKAGRRCPQLSVQMKGAVTVEDLNEVAVAFELELERVRPGFVLVVEYAELDAFEPEAQGVVFYLARRVFQARPEAVLLVNRPGATVSATLRAFVSRLDEGGRVHRFASRAEADAFMSASRLLPA